MIYFLLGVSCGATVMWLWFHLNGLIRSRDEYYFHRWLSGKSVPKDWEARWKEDNDAKG